MIRRFRRHIALACAGALIAVTGIVLTASNQDARAADAANFQPGYLISDENFYNSDAMTVSQIQDFLNKRGANCTGNCLKDKRVDTVSKAANKYCGAYQGARGETAAQIISKVGKACGISPKVLIVMLEKETSLVTMDNPGEWRYERAMGYYCPDDPSRPGWCNPEYAGLYNQLYRAAWQFNQYAANSGDYAYVAGRNNSILYNPDRSCGASNVYIKNQATASLYIYTPYQPNQAALSNLYGSGSGCSSYGNRNFWRLYTDWFESPTDAANKKPMGHFDSASGAADSVVVSGWGVDPDEPGGQVQIEAQVDGVRWVFRTGKPRADVDRAIAAAGPKQGFQARIAAKPGTRKVCVSVLDSNRGAKAELGCKSVVVKSSNRKPVGHLDSTAGSTNSVTISGWGVDPDAPGGKVKIQAYVDGTRWVFHSGKARPDVQRVIPYAGANQGFQTRIAAAPGERKVCLSVLDTKGGPETALGCKTVTVSSSSGATSSSASSASGKSSSTSRSADKAAPKRSSQQRSSASQQTLSIIPRSASDDTAASDGSNDTASVQASASSPNESASESASVEERQPEQSPSGKAQPAESAQANHTPSEASQPDAVAEPATPAESSGEANSNGQAQQPSEQGEPNGKARADSRGRAEPSGEAAPAEQAPRQLSVIPNESVAEAHDLSSSDATELAATGMQPMTTPVLVALGVLLASAAALLGTRALRREP